MLVEERLYKGANDKIESGIARKRSNPRVFFFFFTEGMRLKGGRGWSHMILIPL